MTYRRDEAKAHARSNLKGIWAAALQPFKPDLTLDEAGLRSNIRHWVEDLAIDGLFIAGKQGEFFSMTVEERKRVFEIAVEATRDTAARTIMSCSDQNLETVIALARHAQAVGADYVVVHAPVLHFVTDRDEVLYEYYRTIGEAVDIGIALWSHPDSGYLMSPELCRRIADLPNIVAIKYSVPRDMYAELTRLAGDRLLVSTASEEAWLDNVLELGWRLYLCSTPPYLLQTAGDRRMRAYTDSRLRRQGRGGQAGARQPRAGAAGAARVAPRRQAACAPEVLAGTARPGRRTGTAAAAEPDRCREGGDPARVRGLRAGGAERRGRMSSRAPGRVAILPGRRSCLPVISSAGFVRDARATIGQHRERKHR